jgi:Xaa-Pro aminopeptidase
MHDVLIYADTLRSPELRHEIPAPIMDPFLYAEVGGQPYAVLSQLDADGARAARAGLQVLSPEALGLDELLASGVDAEEALIQLSVKACHEIGVQQAVVPPGFPLELADQLRMQGLSLRVGREFFAERRRVKNPAELHGVRRALRAAEAGMEAAATLLRSAQIDHGTVLVHGRRLTCEELKAAIRAAVTGSGAIAEDLIVSHGAQTAVGHDRGSGPIAPSEPVVIDLWPRDPVSGCFADMTRTFVIGEPGPEMTAWHGLCHEALQRAIQAIRPGIRGRDVYEVVCNVFQEAGHPTQLTKQPGETLRDGFFHALGHGVGLEPHEAPNLGRSQTDVIVAGDVLAIEPGLYRHGFGGCRLEDLVLVTDSGAELLTQYPYGLANGR